MIKPEKSFSDEHCHKYCFSCGTKTIEVKTHSTYNTSDGMRVDHVIRNVRRVVVGLKAAYTQEKMPEASCRVYKEEEDGHNRSITH